MTEQPSDALLFACDEASCHENPLFYEIFTMDDRWDIIRAVLKAAQAVVPAQQAPDPAFIRVGWFNPYNDYHGFQQVHRSYEGGKGTFPLFCRASDLEKTELPTQALPSTERGGPDAS